MVDLMIQVKAVSRRWNTPKSLGWNCIIVHTERRIRKKIIINTLALYTLSNIMLSISKGSLFQTSY